MIPGSKSETPWKIHYFPFLTKKNNFFDESQVPASGGTGGRSSRASPKILEKAIQIYGAAMNAALRCRKYEEGLH